MYIKTTIIIQRIPKSVSAVRTKTIIWYVSVPKIDHSSSASLGQWVIYYATEVDTYRTLINSYKSVIPLIFTAEFFPIDYVVDAGLKYTTLLYI